ncbi:MAG TPA: hypothetical protein VMJ72_01665 [Candidatus Paceibacterota bacterium]|nr:hypothetical protein [Candidatus Paceibacterota bacterium]
MLENTWLFSSGKRVSVTLPDEGFSQQIGLDVKVQFDGRTYHVLVCGTPDSGVPRYLPLKTNDPCVAWVFVTAHATAAALASDLGLPTAAVDQVRRSLEQEFGPKLIPWLEDTRGRICQPAEEPNRKPAIVPVNGPVLVTVDRDVSGIFGRVPGTCVIEYTLFSEPRVFRCLLACHNGGTTKVVDFQKRSVAEIIRYLTGDALALEIAMAFGGSDSRAAHQVSAVLRREFVPNTDLARNASRDVPPIPLVPVPPQPILVFQGGTYYPLRG